MVSFLDPWTCHRDTTKEGQMKLTITVAAAFALLFAASPASSAAAPGVCEGPHYLDVYRVEITPLAPKIERGGIAKVAATVYRFVGEHDLVPAEGANVVVALSAGDFTRAGGAVTDEQGKATVKIRLDRRFPAGWADAGARATRRPADLPCELVQEAGGVHVERFLRVL
jgi:hypothetical protein